MSHENGIANNMSMEAIFFVFVTEKNCNFCGSGLLAKYTRIQEFVKKLERFTNIRINCLELNEFQFIEKKPLMCR